MLTLIAETGFWSLLPEKASTFADWVDPLYYFELWLSIICFVGIGGCMVWFSWKYHMKSRDDHPHGSHHSNTLEITWSVIPLIIVLIIFVWGFRGFMDMTSAKKYGEDIVITGSRWAWQFQYGNGGISPGPAPLVLDENGEPTRDEDGNYIYEHENWGLYVPVNTPIRIVLKAPLDDVLHSFYVPAFRIKKDVVPGRYNTMWFEATETGVFDVYCAEYCGQQHSQMRSRVKVVSEEEYYDYLAYTVRIPDDPVEAGKRYYAIKGCSTCHSTEKNVVITGPSFRDLFGKTEQFTDGSSQVVDEQYIKESIQNPSAKIVKGFQDQMTVMAVSDKEIDALIAYMKSISENFKGELPKAPEASETEAAP